MILNIEILFPYIPPRNNIQSPRAPFVTSLCGHTVAAFQHSLSLSPTVVRITTPRHSLNSIHDSLYSENSRIGAASKWKITNAASLNYRHSRQIKALTFTSSLTHTHTHTCARVHNILLRSTKNELVILNAHTPFAHTHIEVKKRENSIRDF